MLAPARIPVAAGKKMANMEKKVSSSLKSGPRFSKKMAAAKSRRQTSVLAGDLIQIETVATINKEGLTVVTEEPFRLFAF